MGSFPNKTRKAIKTTLKSFYTPSKYLWIFHRTIYLLEANKTELMISESARSFKSTTINKKLKRLQISKFLRMKMRTKAFQTIYPILNSLWKLGTSSLKEKKQLRVEGVGTGKGLRAKRRHRNPLPMMNSDCYKIKNKWLSNKDSRKSTMPDWTSSTWETKRISSSTILTTNRKLSMEAIFNTFAPKDLTGTPDSPYFSRRIKFRGKTTDITNI